MTQAINKETGGAAFPRKIEIGSRGVFTSGELEKLSRENDGMTLRDYFAAKAMQGMLSNPAYFDTAIIGSLGKDISDNAYFIADAMITEKDKP